MVTSKRKALTEATGITADMVMELGKFYSAQEIRSLQTGLTTAARELRALTHTNSLLGRLGANLTREQHDLLRDAAALLDSVKHSVEHAKERKDRAEKAAAKRRAERDRQAARLIAQAFPLPVDTFEGQIELLKLVLVAHTVAIPPLFRDQGRLHQRLREYMQHNNRLIGLTQAQWRASNVSSERLDLLGAFQEFLTWVDSESPEARLQVLQEQLASNRDKVLADPASVETIRLWSEALTPPAKAGGQA
ncbi:hypothetical protein BZL41_27765 [Pseudomonas sp. PIC25]|uniref:hypothetical protein n=1 Tax=Pseudomonas sp. PIC25 TaxID=1958773 RepID=UPI000BAB687F|nr:hypothetical protein [Pseudomonas sp. PIC25]PAU50928.1 hypothetical protein BZL41_27765 [Pseudomonas sp. PIC25]